MAAEGARDGGQRTQEPKTLFWAWVLIFVGNVLMRRFDDGAGAWTGLSIGAAGVIAMPFSLVMSWKSIQGGGGRLLVVVFHLLAVASFAYFVLSS